MNIGVTFSGTPSLMAKLSKLGGNSASEAILMPALETAAVLIHASAVESIMAQGSTGRTYTRGSVTHVASAPGEAPNTDTGKLVSSIKIQKDAKLFTVAVGTDLEYGKFLEFGTTRMAARPWLGPACEKNKSLIVKLFKFDPKLGEAA